MRKRGGEEGAGKALADVASPSLRVPIGHSREGSGRGGARREAHARWCGDALCVPCALTLRGGDGASECSCGGGGISEALSAHRRRRSPRGLQPAPCPRRPRGPPRAAPGPLAVPALPPCEGGGTAGPESSPPPPPAVAPPLAMMFRDQVGIVAGWFKGWNECEQTVALLSLLKRVTRTQARFLQLCLEHSLADCADIHLLEAEANSAAAISQWPQEPAEAAVALLLAHLPLLQPGNAAAKAEYMKRLQKVLAYAIESNRCVEESRQLLSYALIHPATTLDDRSALALWLGHLEERLAGTPQPPRPPPRPDAAPPPPRRAPHDWPEHGPPEIGPPWPEAAPRENGHPPLPSPQQWQWSWGHGCPLLAEESAAPQVRRPLLPDDLRGDDDADRTPPGVAERHQGRAAQDCPQHPEAAGAAERSQSTGEGHLGRWEPVDSTAGAAADHGDAHQGLQAPACPPC
uniref:Sterile alpha motif domain containing 4B n=1 Tax=Gallus gallus TaxID=9031 RepID=A0A8V0Y090_CHICK